MRPIAIFTLLPFCSKESPAAKHVCFHVPLLRIRTLVCCEDSCFLFVVIIVWLVVGIGFALIFCVSGFTFLQALTHFRCHVQCSTIRRERVQHTGFIPSSTRSVLSHQTLPGSGVLQIHRNYPLRNHNIASTSGNNTSGKGATSPLEGQLHETPSSMAELVAGPPSLATAEMGIPSPQMESQEWQHPVFIFTGEAHLVGDQDCCTPLPHREFSDGVVLAGTPE